MFGFVFCQIVLLAESLTAKLIHPQNCEIPFDSHAWDFFVYSWTNSCQYLVWVYILMFVFWPLELSKLLFTCLGYGVEMPVPVDGDGAIPQEIAY